MICCAVGSLLSGITFNEAGRAGRMAASDIADEVRCLRFCFVGEGSDDSIRCRMLLVACCKDVADNDFCPTLDNEVYPTAEKVCPTVDNDGCPTVDKEDCLTADDEACPTVDKEVCLTAENEACLTVDKEVCLMAGEA